MLRTGNSERYRVRTFDHMATYALFEAILPGTYTLQHGLITLVREQVHMVAPHEVGVFNTTVTLTHGDYRHWNPTGCGQAGQADQHYR